MDDTADTSECSGVCTSFSLLTERSIVMKAKYPDKYITNRQQHQTDRAMLMVMHLVRHSIVRARLYDQGLDTPW